MVFSAVAALLMAVGVQAAELEGVQLEDRVKVDGQALQLNGIALRTRMFFKVYVAGLYLPRKATTPEAAIDGPGPKRIVLVMLRDASAEQFCDSVGAGLDANHSEDELELIQPQIDALYEKIRTIAEAKKGMRIVLDYSSSAASTMLYIDGTPQGDPMKGADFFRALLRIWLGERPAEAEVKRMLLRSDENAKE